MLRWLTTLLMICLSFSSLAQDSEVTYEVTQLSNTLTMLKARGGNVVVSAGDDGVFLVDDQWQPMAEQLLAEVTKISDSPIRFVINTHYHADHVGGNELIGGSGAVIIAHDNIRTRLSTDQFNYFQNATTEAWPEDALPVVTFSEGITLHLNGESARVIHVPRGHTDGDAIVYFPESDVIHMGDIYWQGLYPFIDLDGGGTIQGTIEGVKTGLELAGENTQIVPGHGPLGNQDTLQIYQDYLTGSMNRVEQLVSAGKTLEEAIAAKPTAEWDEVYGQVWITPAQWVTFIYNSLTGVDQFTRIPENSSD